MDLITWILLVSICISLAIQAMLVFGFTRLITRDSGPILGDAQCPEAAVILCLRGGDPFLHRCVDALLQQDYPKYRVVFVVDHPEDPALPILHEVLNGHSCKHYEIQFLEDPPMTCSLKCASLLQAYRSLDKTVGFLAQVDADTIPHPRWLRELASGLSQESVGAVTGNRWYAPETTSRGSMVRHVWNAAAIVQMSWYRIAWGGTLAIKMSAIREAQLVDRWSNALCEDTMLTRELSRIGKHVVFRPNLLMVNREDCNLSSFIPWVRRQLLTASLYHRAWPLIVVHGLASATILLAGWGWVLILLTLQGYRHAVVTAVAMTVFQLALVLLVLWIGRAVESRLDRSGRFEPWQRPSFPRWIWIVTITQWVYSWALLRCLFSRSTHWRGIRYRVDGPWRIRMERYQPYTESADVVPSGTQESL